MGRPLNKKFFTGLGQPGFQLGCTAWFTGEGAAESGYVVRQKTNTRYVVESDAGPGTRSELLELVQGAPTAGGQVQITVSPVTGGTENARIINAHQVKTFEGNTYVWPDLVPGDFRAQFEESDLQETTS